MLEPRLLWARGAIVALAIGTLGAGACIASAPSPLRHQTDDDAGTEPPIEIDASVPDAKDDLSSADPHAVVGTDPPHGPFLGGGRVLVYGKGFGADVRVWFGDVEIATDQILPVDTSRVQVTVPPGAAGPVDVAAQNGADDSTRRSLAAGYVYDKAYAEPDKGPVSGGNVIEILGQNTAWDASTVVTIDQKPCSVLTVDGPTALACTLPKGTPGAKVLKIDGGGEVITVLDGYTYEDSDNGFKGGLSGAPLAGQLKVLAFDNFTGDPLAGAHAVVGGDIATALVKDADGSGVAVLVDPSLTGKVTVTVAARCHSPVTFVDVAVDAVTAYLDPVMTPECASAGDPPPVGGKPQHVGTITGELVWDGGQEFQKAPWTTVPLPQGPNERQAAYVFMASGDPTQPFTLPAETSAITPDSPGDLGYGYAISTPAGNRALYAVAGLEDRSVTPPVFLAYAFGVVRGVPVVPNETTEYVYIRMRSTLDEALTQHVTSPAPGPKGPDRLLGHVALMLGNDGYALLPAGLKTPFLPVIDQDLTYVGVPAVSGDLLGSSYMSTARAVTGPLFQTPLSVVGRRITTSTSVPVVIDDFVGVPTLTSPANNAAWDASHLATTFPAGSVVDVSVYDILSGNGLWHWMIAVPAGSHAIQVPHLDGFVLASLPPGPVTINITGGRVAGFDWDYVRYRDLRTSGMTAYAVDSFSAHF